VIRHLSTSRRFLVMLIPFLLQSCGYYSFKGALPSHLQGIAIPLFENRSPYPQVEEKLTNSLIDEFISDNTLKIVDESEADLILSGKIESITDEFVSVTTGETVREIKLVVKVRVKCEDIRQNKTMYENSFVQYSLIEASAGAEQRETAITAALELITEDILNATLGGW